MGIRVQPLDIEVPADSPFSNDLLGRQGTAETLTQLIGNLEGPCVLAVDAAWGFGKTTFLRMWFQYLCKQGFPVVSFNAWETDFSEDPFLTLSSKLTEGLQSNDTGMSGDVIEKIEALKSASVKVLRWIGPGAIRLAAAQVPIIGSELAESAESFAEERLSRHSEAPAAIENFRQDLQEMAATVAKASGSRPLIVMIDELDRCRPSYAVELLEVAKHLFSVDRVVFVLAVNSDQLAHSVKALYGNDFDAEGYLRRFIDVDFKLSAPERQAFIAAQLQATGIGDYFDLPTSNRTFNAGYLLPHPSARQEVSETLVGMLFHFFGSSNLSLRTVSQAIHRLGLLYATLRKDQMDHGLATTVALILRTMEPKLYGQFVAGEVHDAEIVDAIFGRPGLRTLRYDGWSAMFEAAVVLAGLEEDLAHGLRGQPLSSPLLDRYENWDRTTREPSESEEFNDAERREFDHASRVAGMIKRQLESGVTLRGFRDAVRRLELLGDT